MAEVRFPLASDLQIEDFSGAVITKAPSLMVNAVVDKNNIGSNERHFITQRPAFNIKEDASLSVADARGRGIYYWGDTSSLYIVNNNKIYKTSQASPAIGTISSGTDSVIFKEVGALLVLVDAENDEAWTISNTDVVTQITDPSFPSTLAGGAVALDQYLFVMDDSGAIYNSALNDATTWNALDVISSEREPDSGIYVAKHKDHVVSLGSRSIEFFYDAGNPTGSVLSRRQDIYYHVGCVHSDSVWELGDTIFFVGVNPRGGIGVYRLANFELSLISTSSINSYLTESYTRENVRVKASGFPAGSHLFYLLSIYITPAVGADITTIMTLVFDNTTNIWGLWETALTELTGYGGIPIIGWTERTADIPRVGEGILVTGDVIEVIDNLVPIDVVVTDPYVDTDYVLDGYIEVKERTGTNISMKSRVGKIDNEISLDKFMHTLELDADFTKTAQTATISWTDAADPEVMTHSRTVKLDKRQKLPRLGKYNRRTFEFEYSGDEQIRVSSLVGTVSGGRV